MGEPMYKRARNRNAIRYALILILCMLALALFSLQ